MKTKICAVQCKIHKDFNKNLEKVEEYFKEANKKNCDIICFPEVFLTGGLYKKRYNPEIPLKSKKLFSGLSKNYGMFSVMGSVIEKIGSNYYNLSCLFDDNGNMLGDYKKSHLVQSSEAKYLKPGSGVNVFKTKIGKIGIQICRDLLYPEITRKLMLKEAEIIFCPSFWCSKSSGYDWIYSNKYFKNRVPDEVTSLVSARAIESHAVFVYVNAAGHFNSGNSKNELLGKTQIALPFYGTTDALGGKEGVLIKEIDLSIAKDGKLVYKIEKDLNGYY